MPKILEDFDQIEWRTYDTCSALWAFGLFLRDIEELVSDAARTAEERDGPKWTPRGQEEIGEFFEERRIARHAHDEIIRPTFRYSAVITLYAIFERELKRFAENAAKDDKQRITYRELKGRLFDQVSRYTELFRSFKLSDISRYQEVVDLQRVRHCIVHAYGEISLMAEGDQRFLIALGTKDIGLDVLKGLPLDVQERFVARSLDAVWDFFLDLFGRAKWRLEERWLISRNRQPGLREPKTGTTTSPDSTLEGV